MNVVGVDREAKLRNISVEMYARGFIAELRNTELSDPLKSSLLTHIDIIEYRRMSVIRVTVPSQKQMSWVGEKTFIREGSDTIQATPKQISARAEEIVRMYKVR